MTLRYEWISTLGLAALLVACGGRAGNLPETGDAQSQTFTHHKTFTYTGAPQDFSVPHVSWLLVDVRGAAGGSSRTGMGGRGGRVRALISGSLDKELMVYVGGEGESFASYTDGGYAGGFNGGGAGGISQSSSIGSAGAGGGGASDVRLSGGTIDDRVVVAAGGGGVGADWSGGNGGDGGGMIREAGENSSYPKSYTVDCGGYGGKGGTQTAGGAGGEAGDCWPHKGAGANGTSGAGGAGGASANGGGGGGGGFFGGGGGGAGIGGYCTGIYCNIGGGGGGAGGSSFVDKRAKNPHTWKGWKRATCNGMVVISW